MRLLYQAYLKPTTRTQQCLSDVQSSPCTDSLPCSSHDESFVHFHSYNFNPSVYLEYISDLIISLLSLSCSALELYSIAFIDQALIYSLTCPLPKCYDTLPLVRVLKIMIWRGGNELRKTRKWQCYISVYWSTEPLIAFRYLRRF